MALLALPACSAGDDPGSAGSAVESAGSDIATVVHEDPTARLCVLWPELAALMDSDVEPSDELIDDVLERQQGIEEVLPGELSAAWADIVRWNMAFVEWFAAAGYEELTEDVVVAALGGQEAADEAVTALEAGYDSMEEWNDRNCASSEGNAEPFCAAWTDISALLAQVDQEEPTQDSIDELFAAYDEAGAAVPAEIREQWEALLAFAVPFRDALVSVEYDTGRLSDEILTQAFGSASSVATMEQAADAARVAIDEWSITGCGDFCARWGETSGAVDQLGAHHDLGWVRDMGEEGRSQYDEMQARVALAGRLVPDELTTDWAQLEAALADWNAFWAALDFDRGRVDSPEGDARAAELAEASARFEELAVERHVGHPGDRDNFLADLRSSPDSTIRDFWTDVVPWGITSARDRIDDWVDANCEATGGRPGSVSVRMPAVEGAAGSTLLLGIGPPGSSVEDLADPAALLAGDCHPVGSDPWGYWIERDEEGREHVAYQESEGFRAERWGDGLCDFRWEEGPAQLEAGRYTLVAALVEGGTTGRSIAAEPMACLTLDVRVDGETLVPLPDLPPCEADLSALVVDPDPWRTPAPVDPNRAGSVRMTMPALVLPEDIKGEGGELAAVVLPAGTTLNEVGRQQVWPSGGVMVWLPGADEPHGREIRALGPVQVPIMAVPANGAFSGLDPGWLAEAPHERLPLSLLAPGDYDLRVRVTGHSHEGEDHRCGFSTVRIDGDTVVDMPELGECP